MVDCLTANFIISNVSAENLHIYGNSTKPMLSTYSSAGTQEVSLNDTEKINLNVIINFLTDPRLR